MKKQGKIKIIYNEKLKEFTNMRILLKEELWGSGKFPNVNLLNAIESFMTLGFKFNFIGLSGR